MYNRTATVVTAIKVTVATAATILVLSSSLVFDGASMSTTGCWQGSMIMIPIGWGYKVERKARLLAEAKIKGWFSTAVSTMRNHVSFGNVSDSEKFLGTIRFAKTMTIISPS